jgi:D-glycero-D-manno-heptose 1,7-bisphosphate phosphatase
MNLENLRIDRTWTLFLDRDGVINRRLIGGYIQHWDQFDFLPGVPEAIRKFSAIFGRIIVVSNQQGVGKGLMTGADVDAIHKQMQTELEKHGGRIDAVFFSPHLHADGSLQRKPNVGMALQARRLFPGIRFRRSIMAGDSVSDMVFGKRLGMTTVLVGGDITLARNNPGRVDFIFADLITFANAL